MRYLSIVAPLILVLIGSIGCGSDSGTPGSGEGGVGRYGDLPVDAGRPGAADASIAAVWLAQTHVQQSDDPLLRLTAMRAALLKVDIVSPSQGESPSVFAELSLPSGTTTLALTGPDLLPASLETGPGRVQHSRDNSFTAVIPPEWVQAGLRINILAGANTQFLEPAVGAPTIVHMTMFDALYFGGGSGGDYSEGWQEELEAKWPVSDLLLERVPSIAFLTLVVPPRPAVGLPAARVSSRQDYTDQTGQGFDGEQATALLWVRALQNAGGQTRLSLYYVNIYGVNSGGQAGGYAGVGNGTSDGVLHHELGHALSLPHWGNNADYPYKGAMFGIDPPESFNETHAGPTWGYDPATGTFITPLVQEGNPRGEPAGTYKLDPMQGGGTGLQEAPFIYNHFSDYSVFRMQRYLENHVAIWRDDLGEFVSWDVDSNSYSTTRSRNDVNFPLARDVEVISLMAATSTADPGVNHVYPPIGPYTSGLIRTFDPSDADDRAAAASIYCPAGGCDFSLRVMQGGEQRVYMLRANGDETDPLVPASLGTAAVNVPMADGAVTEVSLLSTPNAEIDGLPANPTVLRTWSAN